jgi:hypothetical protein
MGVAGGGILVPRGDDAGGTAALREGALHRGTDPGWLIRRRRKAPAPASHRQDASHAPRADPAHAQQGTRRHRASQICFSGICTTSPSSASETLSWQVRRERSGSGS